MKPRSTYEIAQINPPVYRDRLVNAARRGDMAEIDRVTDELAVLGYCWPRSPDGMSEAGPKCLRGRR